MDSDSPSPLHALLIGINCYLPNELPNGTRYRNLRGCVRDISQIEAFLRTRLEVPGERITRLSATAGADGRPVEPAERWPTYLNLVHAFHDLADTAEPGDRVYVHYSGHGGRTRTIVPEVKGEAGIDEALVPTDIGIPGGRYLRDLELARLLDELVRRELVVTVVLDCCYSGGMTREGSAAVVRGVGTVDGAERPVDSLVATPAELAETWRRLSGSAPRGFALGSGWLPEPRGYTLLAACRPSEWAYEYPFEGNEWRGALTYWLLHSLQALTPGLTYKQVHDRVLARVHGQFESQTPLLQGEGDRVVFGVERIPPVHAALVVRVQPDRVQVGAGQAQGIREGASFALYPPGTLDFTDPERRLAVATVTKLGATRSWARLEGAPARPVEPGALAVLLGAGSVRLVRRIRLLRGEGPAPGALDAVARALAQSGSGWVEGADEGDAEADYLVCVSEAEELEILDGAGAPVGNLAPALRAGDGKAAEALVRRLVHLAKYRAVRETENHDPLSPLAAGLTVELAGRQADYDPADRPAPVPLEDAGNAVREGEWIFLRIRNGTHRDLNVTVLDLQPDWGIGQVYPEGAGEAFVSFGPGEEKLLPFQAYLPDGYEAGEDVLKVFATTGTTSFRILELPALGEAPRSKPRSLTGDPLERLLEAVSAERPATRQLVPAAYASRGWTTAAVPVTIRRGR